MGLFVIHTFVICTLLLGWLFLSADGFLLLFYRRKGKDVLLAFYVIAALWAVTSFNALYEGMLLNEKTALVPSLNSWAFTCIIPLFYLYYRYQITGSYPDTKQWTRHLLIPGILLALYGAGSCFATSPDRFVYTWSELSAHTDTWWMRFRMGCYILMGIQLAVYLPRLFGRNELRCRKPQALRIRQEMIYTLRFCLIAVIAMLTPYLICDFLYNLFLILLAGYVFYRSVFYRFIRRKLAFPVHPKSASAILPAATPEPTDKEEEKTNDIFTPEEESRLTKRLKDPGLLCNPDLTINLLARELSTNETYLSRYFNRQLGLSFPKYITALRLEEAERLLADNVLTILEVSEQAGFQTLSAFYQAFNTKHNCSPSQWRKNQAG